LKFWRVHTAWDDEAAAMEQSTVAAFLFLFPAQFRGRFNRWVMRRGRYFEPPDRADLKAPAENGRRAGGWRVGVVFHTAQLAKNKLMFLTWTGRPATLAPHYRFGDAALRSSTPYVLGTSPRSRWRRSTATRSASGGSSTRPT
jgi:hypothetical protein